MSISISFRSLNLLGGLILHGLLSSLFFVVFIAILILSWPSEIENDRLDVDRVLAHVHGLKASLHHERAMERMQGIFPEGACFTVTLYGLAWANIAPHVEGEARQEAMEEIRFALDCQTSRKAVAPFLDTEVHRGVFWLGQRNLLIAKYLSLLEEIPSENLREEFKANSAELVMQYLISPTRHLDSYSGMCWPTDNMAAFASLHLHDELRGTDYSTVYEEWKEWTLNHLDPKSHMPAGELDSESGDFRQPARGCANSWMIAIMSGFDEQFARDLYERYLESFGIQRLGYRMFREWPKGLDDLGGDIDSGPVIWQAGVTATGVGLAAARSQGDGRTEADIRDLTRLFGIPLRGTFEGHSTVEYLFGMLPVGDAFLAWAYSIERPEEMFTEIPGRVDRLRNRWLWMAIVLFLTVLVPVQGVYFIRKGWRNLQRLDS
ncbi:MAG: hypothetical protein KC994_11640 [Candidatus Omnitrophica bacterium]|nr:hypothetical protein [Candidatus Omnitrophota bacterium]